MIVSFPSSWKTSKALAGRLIKMNQFTHTHTHTHLVAIISLYFLLSLFLPRKWVVENAKTKGNMDFYSSIFHNYRALELNIKVFCCCKSVVLVCELGVTLLHALDLRVFIYKVLNCGCDHGCGYVAIIDIVDKCGCCGCNWGRGFHENLDISATIAVAARNIKPSFFICIFST